MSAHTSVSIEREWSVGSAVRRIAVTVSAPSSPYAIGQCSKAAVETIDEAGAGVEGFQVRRV